MIFFAIAVLYLFFILSCFCISYIIFDTIVERKKALKIFLLSSLLYFIFALFAYWAYAINNNSFFQYPDQENFYEMSQYLGRLPNLKSIFDGCFTDQVYLILTENQGAYFYLGITSYFANHCLGGNNVLFQILNVSFLAALIPVFVFRILTTFVSVKRAFKSTIVFVFLFIYILLFTLDIEGYTYRTIIYNWFIFVIFFF